MISKTEHVLFDGTRLKCNALPDYYSEFNLDVCEFSQNPVQPGKYRLQSQFLITPDGKQDKFHINFIVNNTNKEPAQSSMENKIGIF